MGVADPSRMDALQQEEIEKVIERRMGLNPMIRYSDLDHRSISENLGRESPLCGEAQ